MNIKNKKAFFNYQILETLEVGIMLTGSEVKSIREGRVNLGDSYVKILNGELYLLGADIPKYKFNGDVNYDSTRTRKLLIKKKELLHLESKMRQGRLTLIPTGIYTKRDKVKLSVGLAKGKKDREKKMLQRERDLNLDLHRQKRAFGV